MLQLMNTLSTASHCRNEAFPGDAGRSTGRPIIAELGACGAGDKQTTRIMKDLRASEPASVDSRPAIDGCLSV